MASDDINIQEIESEFLDQEEDTALYKINTYGVDFSLEVYSNKIDEGDILIPPFQRRYVWPPKKASKLIESFLLGLPVPQVFLYREPDTERLLVVDGQQRLKTINQYFNGKFENGHTFYLNGVKQQWEGKAYSDLSEPDRRRLKNTPLRGTIFEQTDPKDNSSMFQIFERLNTGGMPLSQQEIRNSIYHGNIVEFLKKLNLDANWRKLLKKPRPDDRMRDIEMILRFFALLENWKRYKPYMKDFISRYMERHRNIKEEEEKKLSAIFKHTMATIYERIGENAFRVKTGVNVAVLDAVSIAIAELGNKHNSALKKSFQSLINSKPFIDSVSQSTTNKDQVEARIKLAKQKFSS